MLEYYYWGCMLNLLLLCVSKCLFDYFFFHSIGPIFPRRPPWHGNYRLSKLRSSTLPNIYNFWLLLSSHEILRQRPRRKLKSSLFHTGDQKHMGLVLFRDRKKPNSVECLCMYLCRSTKYYTCHIILLFYT